MKKYILNGENMSTRESAYNEIARALEMPVHFGRNLDALWDELSCMQAEIVLVNPAYLSSMGDYAEKLLATFTDAAAENPRLSFHIEENVN